MARVHRSFQKDSPGVAAWAGQPSQQRSVPRILSKLPAWITLHSHDCQEHVAFVRDISPRGIFFYSDFNPQPGDEIVFVLQYLTSGKGPRLHCKGRVVRLEPAPQGSALGIAVSFDPAGKEKC